MSTKPILAIEDKALQSSAAKLLKQYGCGLIEFTGSDGLYERHLLFDTHGDFYMHLADFESYLEADRRLVELYAQPHDWVRHNIASSGRFSSDRTIAEYAAEIWKAKLCPVQ